MKKLLIDTVNFENGGGVEVYKQKKYYKLSTYSNVQGAQTHVCYSIPEDKYTINEIKDIIERNNIKDYFKFFMTKKGYRVE